MASTYIFLRQSKAMKATVNALVSMHRLLHLEYSPVSGSMPDQIET